MDGKFVGFLIAVERFRQFALMPLLPNLHMSAICKLGKGIN
jgi:hypothetical protein